MATKAQIKLETSIRASVVKIDDLIAMGPEGIVRTYREFNKLVRGEIRRRLPKGTKPHGYTGEDGNPLRKSVKGRTRKSRTTGAVKSWVSIRRASGIWIDKGTAERRQLSGRFTGRVKARPVMVPAALKFTGRLGPKLTKEMARLGQSSKLQRIAYTSKADRFKWR